MNCIGVPARAAVAVVAAALVVAGGPTVAYADTGVTIGEDAYGSDHRPSRPGRVTIDG
ncbi:MAG: hypothetical protein ACLGI2_17400 [Acidimicrobiia bacterium]